MLVNSDTERFSLRHYIITLRLTTVILFSSNKTIILSNEKAIEIGCVFQFIMLAKTPASTFKRALNLTLKTAFLVEAAGFAVSFGVWYKLNTDRDFRLYMFKNHSWALDSYYTLGEKIADQRTREHDLKVWSNEGKI